LKTISAALAVLGLVLATVMVGYYGFGTVVRSTVAVGGSGFALVVAWQLSLFVVLGAAWDVIVPRQKSAPPWVFLWGRMVRDSAANCLPFSQMGGFVLGARAVRLHGIRWPVAVASTIVDVTTEMFAQIAFAAIGLAILLVRAPHSSLVRPLAAVLVVALAAGLGFIWAQHRAGPAVSRLGRRMAQEWFAEAGKGIDAVHIELGRIYGRPLRLALGSVLHLLGWIGTGVAGWLAYRLLGAPIDLVSVLAVEALLNATLAMAFLVPGGIGVQEAGYALFGTIFGLPAELSLSVSLLRRARDLTIGVPVLLIWQMAEARRLRVGARTSS
jgi:glycosyltransferase 2 family protein